MTTAWALSEEFEDGVRLAAVQLSDVPSVPARPAVPGQLRGPALLCALRGAPHFARVARNLDTVPGAIRIGSSNGKIGYRRNPGQRGGGDNIASTANDAQTVPTLGAFITMLTQLWRGVGELGDGGAVHALLDPEVPSAAAGRAPCCRPSRSGCSSSSSWRSSRRRAPRPGGHAGRVAGGGGPGGGRRRRRGAGRGEPEAQVRSC